MISYKAVSQFLDHAQVKRGFRGLSGFDHLRPGSGECYREMLSSALVDMD